MSAQTKQKTEIETVSYSLGVNIGENIQKQFSDIDTANFYDGIKWDNEIKKDEEDVFWFDYDYYVTCDEIEYSITYKS